MICKNAFGSVDASFVAQCEGDLGQRLRDAAVDAFDSGCNKVVIVGTDCPDLDVTYLARAFDSLNQFDVVLGPAVDGGYTLIGLNGKHPELFSGIEWSTDKVLSTTLENCEAIN